MPTPSRQQSHQNPVGRKLNPEFDVQLELQGISAKLDTIIEELRALRQSIGARQNPVQR